MTGQAVGVVGQTPQTRGPAHVVPGTPGTAHPAFCAGQWGSRERPVNVTDNVREFRAPCLAHGGPHCRGWRAWVSVLRRATGRGPGRRHEEQSSIKRPVSLSENTGTPRVGSGGEGIGIPWPRREPGPLAGLLRELQWDRGARPAGGQAHGAVSSGRSPRHRGGFTLRRYPVGPTEQNTASRSRSSVDGPSSQGPLWPRAERE